MDLIVDRAAVNSVDPYLNKALDRARKLESQDHRFALPGNGAMVQGRNNRVIPGTYADQPVIFKYYGEEGGIHIGQPRDRMGRECFFLNCYSASGLVPTLHCQGDDFAVIARFPGVTFPNSSADRETKDRISYEIGSAHARILQIRVSDEKRCRFDREFFDSQSFDDLALSCVDRIQCRMRSDAGFSGEDLRDSVEFMEGWFKRNSIESPWALHKQDWNLNNVLVQGGKLSGFIDFEQSFSGTREAYLGAVLDCLHSAVQKGKIRWELVKTGYEETSGERLTRDGCEAVLVMAHVNAWRVLEGADSHLFPAARTRLLPRDFVV